MQPEDNEIYGTYTSPYQPVSPAPVGVLEPPPITDTPSEQGIVESPGSPAGPSSPPPIPPRKRRRPGPAGAIVLLALILALIFGTGLFSGWEFAHASTTTTAGTTSTATSSSTTSLQAQQEAAIAKIEPAVVELEVTTAQGGRLAQG